MTDQQTVIHVKVTPKSSKDQIVGWEDEVLKVKVRAVPEKGEANRAVIKLLSKSLGIPQRDVILLKGETARQKQFCLLNLSRSSFLEKVEMLISKP